MTDKELAKEYVDKLYAEKVSKEDYDKDGWILYRSEDIGDAFLNGLKAGRPKWHDLRNNPNDLPTCDCETITIHENGNKNIQKWKNGDWNNAIVIPVIAWCEIPQYEEE